MSHKTDQQLIDGTHNTARYFTETRQVAWVLLVATLVGGAFAYARMPKRKDPYIKTRVAVAICAWPGASAERVEELITRKIEERVAQNTDVDIIESSSRTGVSLVTVTLRDEVPLDGIPKAFDDIDLKLRSIRNLPPGSLPIEFQKDFGDTAALMLTVASPKARDVEISLRARAITVALSEARAKTEGARTAVVLSFPGKLNPAPLRRIVRLFSTFALASGQVRDVNFIEGSGFFALDGQVDGESVWLALVARFREELSSHFHPELWRPIIVGDPFSAEAALRAAAGDAYTYRDLDDFSDVIAKYLRAVPLVAKVSRAGVLDERIYLDYSQERLAALGLTPGTMRDAIAAQNVRTPGGLLDANGRNLTIESSGEFASELDIGSTLLTSTASGVPVYVRDVVDVTRDYEAPPLYLNYYTRKDASGALVRTRAITVAVQMRAGEQVAQFSRSVNAALAQITRTLPEDLVVARTSDQPRQVEQKIGLFMTSLYEAIIIIIFVGLIGFFDWRSTVVLALSIPATLAMTFIFMWALGIDVQQMSIAALILALGLLVDDPVVAGDAIKQELDQGKSRLVAAWLGPTKLGRAIVFATITNIVAYLPFLLIRGDVGHFIYSLPVVLGCSLVASRLVSMTFIPLLGYVLLRPKKQKPAVARPRGFMAGYRGMVGWAIDHRYVVLALSLGILVAGGLAGRKLRSSFFPQDYAHLFYVDIFLPEDASIRATSEASAQADLLIRQVAQDFAQKRPGSDGKPKEVLRSITTFVGGGAPRFWYSLAPQQRQLNYAQIVVELVDEHDTSHFVPPLQRVLTSGISGARIDVRQLENGKPVPRPVEIRFSGDDPKTLRALADETKAILRQVPIAARVRDDWGENGFRVKIDVDSARASVAGVSSLDVATTSAAGYSGILMNVLREGDKLIPIVARLRYEERGNAGDIQDLYVLSGRGSQKVPLGQIAHVSYDYALEKIQRRNQRRTISVSCFPAAGMLPSEVMKVVRTQLGGVAAKLSPGYAMDIGGTEENVSKVRGDSLVVAVVSLLGILLTLLLQFKHAIKPLIVLAAIPYGIAGAVIAIVVMGSPFGFTAILGVISLVGVIVSHIIVLFDYIEEMHERGEPFRQALLDAGTLRLRPVLITVGATVLGLIPLALHGGPLWEPLCYAQIGGLTLATVITLLLVPILYAVFVLDLKWVRWHAVETTAPTPVGLDWDAEDGSFREAATHIKQRR